MYAFVWRNWNLVDPGRMAKTIGCSVKEIHAIPGSMGLPAAQPIPSTFKKQIYITVLRRNWHLLPYDQLLTLLDMRHEELEFSLKEDDFLFYKFGNLKPACSPINYTEPDKQTLMCAQEIKQLVEKYFKAARDQAAQPLFGFIEAAECRKQKALIFTARLRNPVIEINVRLPLLI